jgi:hypothetical protein
MNNVKYVIVDGCAIVFPASIEHKSMVGYGERCDGAGFVSFYVKENEYGEDVIRARCTGESYSLKIKAREIDSEIVTNQITNTFF